MDFLSAAVGAVQGAYCDALGAIGNSTALRSVPLGTGIAEAGNFLASAFCNRPTPQPDPPPFSGGQCQITYQVRWDYTLKQKRRNNNQELDSSGFHLANLPGPIASITGSPFNTTDANMFVRAAHRLGTYEYPLPGSDFIYVLTEFSVTGRSVTPLGGASDNCGSLPGTIPDYVPGDNQRPITINYTDASNNSISLDANIEFGFHINNSVGDIIAPFNIDFTNNPEININGEINLTTGNIIFGNGDPARPNRDRSPCGNDYVPDPGCPAPPAGITTLPPTGDPDPNEPETREILRGCIVTTSSVPDGITQIFQDDNPDIYAPRLGHVNFLIEVGSAQAWTADIPIKNLRQICTCDWPGGAIAVRGTPNLGTVWTISPVFTRITYDDAYPPES